jgi:hypothetical protein
VKADIKVWRGWARIGLGMAQIFGATGLLVTYVMAGWCPLALIWAVVVIGALAASRWLFYRRFWWGFEERSNP